MLKRVFGLHGTGKSEYILKMLEECVGRKEEAFLIVPEQQAVSAERLLIDRLGNPANMYVEVINFKRLCNRVFRESGGIAGGTADNVVCQIAMSHVLSQVSDMLSEYSAISENPDFALRMLSVSEEMHRCRITPEAIENICKLDEISKNTRLCAKLRDISLITGAYEAYTSKNLDFPGDLQDKLIETLYGFNFFKDKYVFLDSFYGFTAQELEIIGRIISGAKLCCVSFLCESEKQKDPCFSRAVSGAKACRAMAAKYGIECKDVFLTDNHKYEKGSALETVAANFSFSALSLPAAESAKAGIQIVSCADIYDEVRFAVQTVSDLLMENVKPREIVICSRSPGEYEGILDDCAHLTGIPLTYDKRSDLSVTPVAALVNAAFDVYFSWSKNSVISYIKTGLSGLDDKSADILELYMQTWNIGGKAYFHEEWLMNPLGLRETPPDERLLEKIRAARDDVLSVLDAFCQELDKASTAKDICRVIYNLTLNIARLNSSQYFDDKADGEYIDLLYRLLDSIASTIGGEQISARRFSELLRSVMRSVFSGKIPESIDSIRFSDVSLMRADSVKYVILLGANDGVFPQKPKADNLLGNSERRLLRSAGLDIWEPDEDKAYDELFLAYTALCSASRGAFVTYRSHTVSGTELYPSVIIGLLKHLCGIKEEIRTETPLKALSDEYLFSEFLTMRPGTEKNTVFKYFKDKPEFSERMARLYKPDDSLEALSENSLEALYGDGDIVSSYSKLEKFRRCPFSYFCAYTLRLSPQAKGEIGAAEHGNIVHKILEETVPVICSKASQNESFGEGELEGIVRTNLDELLNRLMPESGALSNRFRHMFKKIETSLIPLCKMIVEELRASKFVPVDFELDLSDAGNVAPAEIPLQDGKMLKIIGKIDRVDLFKDPKTEKSWIRITDYKTGSTKFNLDDVKSGFNLQMLLYLYTLVKNGSEQYGNVYPAGVIYTTVVPPSGNDDISNTCKPAYSAPEFKAETSGIVVNDFDVVFAMDRSGSGQFIPVKLKDGMLDKNAKNTLPFDDFAALLEESVKFAGEMADGIRHGDKRAIPESPKGKDVCEFCDYSEICPAK